MLTLLQKLAAAFNKIKISSKELDHLIIYAQQELNVGDEVLIGHGNFTGIRGKIVGIDVANNEANVEVDLFGKPIFKSVPLSGLSLIKAKTQETQSKPKLDLDSDLYTYQEYARRDPAHFLEQITPIFDELDATKTQLVEQTLKNVTDKFSQGELSTEEWINSAGQFLKQYPEYFIQSIFQNSLARILEKLSYKFDESILPLIPESLILETFNAPNSISGLDNKSSFAHTLSFNIRVLKHLQKFFPNFIGMLGFYIATHEPYIYLVYKLDQIFGEQIEKNDVIEHLFNKDVIQFLESPESKEFPQLQKKAIHKLIYDSESGPEELAFFFTNNYWQTYSLWTPDAINKMVYKYADQLDFLNDGTANFSNTISGFLATEFGRELALKMANHLLDNNKYYEFFNSGYQTLFPELGFKVAQEILEKGTDQDLNIFKNFDLTTKYPQLLSKYYTRLKKIKKPRPETEEERNMRWDQEDLQRQQEWNKQQQDKKEFQEQPDVRTIEPDKDEDLLDYFPRGQ